MIRSGDGASYSDVLASVQPGEGAEPNDCHYETRYEAIATLQDLLPLDLERVLAAPAHSASELRSQMG